MAHLAKYTIENCRAVLQHDTRSKTSGEYKNPDIDPSKTHLNYSLLNDNTDAYEKLTKRLQNVQIQKRADVKVLCSWVVTLPLANADVTPHDRDVFFKSVHHFLVKEYGIQNVISSDVHLDETTPHLHFTFVPIVQNTKKYKDPTKKPKYSEKVCSKQILTQEYMEKFHERLDKYVFRDTVQNLQRYTEFQIRTGKTTYNKSIDELKQETAQKKAESIVSEAQKRNEQLKQENERIQKQARDVLENTRKQKQTAQKQLEEVTEQIESLQERKSSILKRAEAEAEEILSSAEEDAKNIKKQALEAQKKADNEYNEAIKLSSTLTAKFMDLRDIKPQEYPWYSRREAETKGVFNKTRFVTVPENEYNELYDGFLKRYTVDDVEKRVHIYLQEASGLASSYYVKQIKDLQSENQDLKSKLSSNKYLEQLEEENERLKKENTELKSKFEVVKSIVLDMWIYVSEYAKSQLEKIGIRKNRSYHR